MTTSREITQQEALRKSWKLIRRWKPEIATREFDANKGIFVGALLGSVIGTAAATTMTTPLTIVLFPVFFATFGSTVGLFYEGWMFYQGEMRRKHTIAHIIMEQYKQQRIASGFPYLEFWQLTEHEAINWMAQNLESEIQNINLR